MPDRSRIPRTIAEFDSYIGTTNRYLQKEIELPDNSLLANYKRLSLPDSAINQWKAFSREWEELFVLYSDKNESRTTASRDKLQDVKKRFIAFASSWLDTIGPPAASISDMEVLRIKKGALHKAKHTQRMAPIAESPVLNLISLGGAHILVRCLKSNLTKRAGILPGATAVELCYAVTASKKIKHKNLVHHHISTKGFFTLVLDMKGKGKTLFVSARWLVLNRPSLNGPWSEMITTVVA